MFEEYNDYELVFLAKEGNEEAIDLIYQKYKPIIVTKSKDAIVTASHHGIEISDIMQEGFIGLDEAINAFSEQDNTSFYTFAVLCINRQIINYLKKTTGGKDKILNEAVTIDEYFEKTLTDDYNTEHSVIYREIEEELFEKLERNLTDFEKTVFKLKMDGYTFEEIGNNIDKDIKSIYNTFQRIKVKIKKILDEDDFF